MATSTIVTVAIANTQLLNMKKSNTHKYWSYREGPGFQGAIARSAVERMEDIVAAGATGTVDGTAGDMFVSPASVFV